MTIQEMHKNNASLQVVTAQTLKNHILKNRDLFKSSVNIIKNKTRNTIRIIDEKLFLTDYAKLSA